MPYQNISTHLLPIICGCHFVLSLFFLLISDYKRYVATYLTFCGLVAICEVVCLFSLPSDLGFAGMGYLWFPIISFVIAAFMFVVKSIGSIIRENLKRRR